MDNEELMEELLQSDKENIIGKIGDLDILKTLYRVYMDYNAIFNDDFNSFNSKLSSLSSLVMSTIGAVIAIVAIFTSLQGYHIFFSNIYIIIAIVTTIFSVILLIFLLFKLCKALDFKEYITVDTRFPLMVIKKMLVKIQPEKFYRKMLFCMYKIQYTNSNKLEENKKILPYSFKLYIFCVILFLISFILAIIGV